MMRETKIESRISKAEAKSGFEILGPLRAAQGFLPTDLTPAMASGRGF